MRDKISSDGWLTESRCFRRAVVGAEELVGEVYWMKRDRKMMSVLNWRGLEDKRVVESRRGRTRVV
jgi:hypothetical protein